MEYYYGQEADMFTFYRIPKLLFTDPRYKPLSTDAKLLYGLMLDRMGLSLKNKKQDTQGRTYIFFRQEEAAELLDVGKDKAIKLYRELEKAGLIERKRQGLTHPDIIYVGRLTPVPEKLPKETNLEVGKTAPLKSEKPSSGKRKNRVQESGKTEFYLNNIYSIYTPMNESIYQSDEIDVAKEPKSDENVYSREQYEAMFKAYIHYDHFQQRKYPGEYTMDEIDELVTLMADECASRRPTIRAAGEVIPRSDFRRRLMNISDTDVSRILYKLENPTDPSKRIINRRAYLITMLWNYQSTDPTPEEAW